MTKFYIFYGFLVKLFALFVENVEKKEIRRKNIYDWLYF